MIFRFSVEYELQNNRRHTDKGIYKGTRTDRQTNKRAPRNGSLHAHVFTTAVVYCAAPSGHVMRLLKEDDVIVWRGNKSPPNGNTVSNDTTNCGHKISPSDRFLCHCASYNPTPFRRRVSSRTRFVQSGVP